MEQLVLQDVEVTLTEEGGAVRVTSPGREILLADQNIENVILLIEANFKLVDSFYLKRTEGEHKSIFSPADIHRLSVSIVLYYLSMYNMWRLQYPNRKYQDLGFKQEDLQHPSTDDIIFRYYKDKYPNDWEIKCSILMAMELEELKQYYERREQYYNK